MYEWSNNQSWKVFLACRRKLVNKTVAKEKYKIPVASSITKLTRRRRTPKIWRNQHHHHHQSVASWSASDSFFFSMSCLRGLLRWSREHKHRVANDFSGALFHHPSWNCKHELFLEVCKHVTLSWVLKIKGLKCTKCSIKPEGQGFTRIRPPWGRAKGAQIQENSPPRALHGIKTIINFLKKISQYSPDDADWVSWDF
jgi:hypothetical protein